MSGRKIRLPRPNIFIVIVVALWIGIIVYSTIAMSNSYVDQNVNIMSAVATALLVLAALPLAAIIHYTNKDERFRHVTRGLLWFVVLIVASDVAVYLVPDMIGNNGIEVIGQFMYLGACFAILIPAGLAGMHRKKDKEIITDILLTGAGIAVITLAWYAGISGIMATHINGPAISWSAAFVAIESLVTLILIRQSFQDLPKDIKTLFLLIAVYFCLEVVGDAANLYALLQLRTAVGAGYITVVSAICFSMADIFLTAALGLYSWKTINPFTVKMINDKLIDTRRMMNDLIGQSPDAICIYSPEGNAVTANERFYRIQNVSPDDVAGKYNIFSGMEAMGISGSAVAKLKNGETVVVKDLHYPRDGLRLTVKIYPTYAADGAISGYISIFEDITERVCNEEKIRASLDEKNVLLKEIHHRVKNNLQIISSLLNLQSSYISDPVALGYFEESQNRVKSMALVHERLYQSENLSRINFTDYINNLARSLFLSYNIGAGKVRMNIEAENHYINIDKAISCGLILNELLTNSLKYAFPGDRTGVISVRMSVANSRCIMTISDDGVGFPEDIDFQNTATLGMQLIVMLTSQIDGTIELDRSAGTHFTITFPV